MRHENILGVIGDTPLVGVHALSPNPEVRIFAKLEGQNPGGSSKDRIALKMIELAEREGAIQPGATILEPSSGNTGIGLALVGAARGYRVVLCVPEGYSREKMKIMEALGGEIEYLPEEQGMKGAIERAREMATEVKDSFVPQQFENPSNPCFHEQTTAQEIIKQMDGRIDALVIGAGTAGTFTGIARALKKLKSDTFCVLVEPEGSIIGGGRPGKHKVEGIGQSQFIPKNCELDLADEVMMITDKEAFATVRKLAEMEGVLGGGSSGAAAAAAYRIAERMGSGKRVVTLFPDGAERYMSQGIFD
jgi:cysteine synthase A